MEPPAHRRRSPHASPRHHVESVIAFEEPSCLLIGGWVLRPDDLAGIEIVSTREGIEAYVPSRIVWHPRSDVVSAHGRSEPDAGFHALWDMPPEAASGPLYMAFRMADGRLLMGEALLASPWSEELAPAARGPFRAHRGLAPTDLLSREPLPMQLLRAAAVPSHEFSETAALWVEHVVPLTDGSFYLSGWCHADAGFERLVIVGDDGRVIADVAREATFYPRPDVGARLDGRAPAGADLGFALRIALPEGASPPRMLGALTKDGQLFGQELAPTVDESPEVTAERLLHTVPADIEREGELMDRHLGHALLALRTRLPRETTSRRRDLGEPIPDPVGTIVVTTDGAPDWLRHQLAAFEGDADLERWRLVYVVRDPEAAAAFSAAAEDVYEHFGARLTILTPSEALGHAEAVEAGARVASGSHLVLLDERVLPREAGWLSRLAAAQASAPDVGAIGPVLVGDAGTILQGSTKLVASPHRVAWTVPRCDHWGMPETIATFAPLGEVGTLSTACLLVDRPLFESVGGLSSPYWQHAFAEHDLGRRLRAAGRRLLLAGDVRMDDLRAASPAGRRRDRARERLDHFDWWLLHHRHPAEGLRP